MAPLFSPGRPSSLSFRCRPHGNGVALAAEIPGATLLTLPGIGQGVPRVTWPAVMEALLRHTS